MIELNTGTARHLEALPKDKRDKMEYETIQELRVALREYNKTKSRKEVTTSLWQICLAAVAIFIGIVALDKVKKALRYVLLTAGGVMFLMGFLKNRTHLKELNRYEADPEYAGEQYAHLEDGNLVLDAGSKGIKIKGNYEKKIFYLVVFALILVIIRLGFMKKGSLQIVINKWKNFLETRFGISGAPKVTPQEEREINDL